MRNLYGAILRGALRQPRKWAVLIAGVTLATAVSGIVCLLFDTIQYSMNQRIIRTAGAYHMLLPGLPGETAARVRNHEFVTASAAYRILGATQEISLRNGKVLKADLAAAEGDPELEGLLSVNVKGRKPEALDEIALDRELYLALRDQYQIGTGMQIRLQLPQSAGQLEILNVTITGVFDPPGFSPLDAPYRILASPALAEELAGRTDLNRLKYDLYTVVREDGNLEDNLLDVLRECRIQTLGT
ncbi:MAG TPA: hypothetical protein DD727_01360 [Clostridiales bacterium]|nr:hypothetical protein [Clostridiales bacterium]